jgi:hypothetical protein
MAKWQARMRTGNADKPVFLGSYMGCRQSNAEPRYSSGMALARAGYSSANRWAARESTQSCEAGSSINQKVNANNS